MLINVCGINKPAAGLCVSHLVVELSEGRRKLEAAGARLCSDSHSAATEPPHLDRGCLCPDLVPKTTQSHNFMKA